jgi:hypothetical protein
MPRFILPVCHRCCHWRRIFVTSEVVFVKRFKKFRVSSYGKSKVLDRIRIHFHEVRYVAEPDPAKLNYSDPDPQYSLLLFIVSEGQ